MSATFFWISKIFFLLMLVIPTTFQIERGFILALILIGAIFKASTGSWLINNKVLLIGIMCIFTSLIFMTIGVIYNAPGAIKVGTVYVLWPLLYLFLMGALRNPECYLAFIKVIIIGSILSSLSGFLSVFEVFAFGSSGIADSLGGQVGIYDGKIEFFLMNSGTVIFALPFLLCILMLPAAMNPIGRFWLNLSFIAFILCIFCVLIAGRRALTVVGLLSPIIVFILFRLTGIKFVMQWRHLFISLLIGIASVVLIFYLFDLDITVILDDFFSGFDFDAASTDRRSSGVRMEQFSALIDGWLKRPFFGHGLGSGVEGVIRDSDSPWAYELTYVAILFQVGIVGFLIYTVALSWLFVRSVILIRRINEAAMLLLPLLAGSVGFLLATATNPYLLKFDYLWVIFLPVAVLNSYLINQRNFRVSPPLVASSVSVNRKLVRNGTKKPVLG